MQHFPVHGIFIQSAHLQMVPFQPPLASKKIRLVTLSGDVKENGKLKTDHDAIFGVDVKYYADKVEFTQIVKLKSAVKTNVTGTIKYMVCNDKMCLPPKTIPFQYSVAVNSLSVTSCVT